MSKFNLEEYKKKVKDREVQYKKHSFIPVDECLQEVLGLPGIPRGHITQIFGKSDTGKTSMLFHLAAEAQAAGDLPVIYVTEGKVDWNRAKEMGLDKEGYALVYDSPAKDLVKLGVAVVASVPSILFLMISLSTFGYSALVVGILALVVGLN